MLKLVAACLIASGLFLPLSSCRSYVGPHKEEIHYVDAQGGPTTPGAQTSGKGVEPIEVYLRSHPLPPELRVKKDYKYFFSEGSLRDPSQWLCLLALLWPLLWVAVAARIGPGRGSSWADLVAPFLLCGTGLALVLKASAGNHFEVGYWTTLAGILLYGMTGARAHGALLQRRFPGWHPGVRHTLMALVFCLGPAFPLWQIRGHLVP